MAEVYSFNTMNFPVCMVCACVCRKSSACVSWGSEQSSARCAHRGGPLQRQGGRRLARILAVVGGGDHLGSTAIHRADGSAGQERSQWVSPYPSNIESYFLSGVLVWDIHSYLYCMDYEVGILPKALLQFPIYTYVIVVLGGIMKLEYFQKRCYSSPYLRT
jgi:hypothetical protein